MPVNLYYTQRVRGFQQESVKYSKESVEIRLKRTKHQCPHCGSTSVTVEPIRSRRIRSEPLGSCRKVVLEFTIHRLYCHSCHHRELEDWVRRRITAKMDDSQRKQLKGLQFIFLRNNEDLPDDAKRILKNMRGDFQDLGDAYMFKEEF